MPATTKELLKNYDWEQTGDLIDTDNKFMKKLKEGLKEILARTFFKKSFGSFYIKKRKINLANLLVNRVPSDKTLTLFFYKI